MIAADGAPASVLPTFSDVRAAADRLAGEAVRTPLLSARLLDDLAGRRILVKAEPLQRTGSFKFRGAFNKLSCLSADERRRGVVAFSSGNHAQGVAHAAQILGIPATIVMPTDAPAIKRRNTEAYGATVIEYERHRENREAIAARVVAERGLTLVRPYDDAAIIAGQGTVGLEIAAQCAERDVRPDAILCCCGGGGLIAGLSLALEALMPGVPVHPVEPAGQDDTRRSLLSGVREGNDPDSRSLCDGLGAPMPGELTFAINRRTLSAGFAVDDRAVLGAMAAAFETLKLVVEPSGAAALAAALSVEVLPEARMVAVVVTGGNVDSATFAQAIALA
jgi:threonine dehydratase